LEDTRGAVASDRSPEAEMLELQAVYISRQPSRGHVSVAAAATARVSAPAPSRRLLKNGGFWRLV